jgi:hypothetical protein
MSRLESGRWRWLAPLGAVVLAFGCQGKGGASKNAVSASNLVALPDSSAAYYVSGHLYGLSATGLPTWQVALPEKATIVARLAVAPNSTVYARSDKGLHAIGAGGKLLWTVRLPEPPSWLSREILAPVALTNSSAVVLENPDRLRAFSVDGSEIWTSAMPGGELRGPLAACPNGQLLVMTTTGVYGISPQGQLVWSYAPPPAP